MDTRTDRRTFMTRALGGLAALARPTRALAGGEAAGRMLVLIQLTGGNDGLSCLVPYGDDGYARARRTTRIRPDEVLRIDERVGLHPAWRELHELFQRGRL